MASGWKAYLERGLVGLGLHRRALRRLAPSAVVLAYHNIVPRGERPAGDLSLHLDQADFADQLDVLAETHDVVPLEALAAPWTSDRPRAVITFDDAYRGALTAGLEELERRDMPSTVMVAPGILGTATWWDALSLPDQPGLAPELRRHALEVLQGRGGRILDWARDEGLPMAELPDHALPATAEEVIEAGRRGKTALGVHTWGHPNLAVLTEAECADEYDRSRAWLEERAPRFSDWLAYPYGLHAPPAVTAARERFVGTLLIEGGLAWRRGRPMAGDAGTPRINVPRGLSPAGLRLRLGGVLPG